MKSVEFSNIVESILDIRASSMPIFSVFMEKKLTKYCNFHAFSMEGIIFPHVHYLKPYFQVRDPWSHTEIKPLIISISIGVILKN